jgi:hypothetical protein
MVLATVRATSTTYHVELSGNDSNSGLDGTPWRTLEKALQSVAPDQGNVIEVGQGTFTVSGILTLKSGVSLIGEGSAKTKILVNHHFCLTDSVPNANPHVDTFPEHFVLQVEGNNQTLKGFSLDGQEKRCHGGIFAARSSQVLFEDLSVSNFRYCGLWVIDAHETTLRFSSFKNNTYGNPNRGDSGAVQYHRGKNLTIHDNRIEETGNVRPDMGGYAMKAQDRRHSVSAANVLQGFKMYNNVLIVPSNGAWEKGIAPAFAAEFLGMALKDCEIHNNLLNGTLSLAGPALSGEGIRIHHNFFNIGRGRYGYAVEANVSNVEIDHNYFFGGLHPIAVFGRDPKNHHIHHNIFEAASADGFAGRDLLRYRVPVANLRFINNTVIDNGSIGQIFNLHPSTTFEIRNNLFIRPGEPKDIWGPEVPGKISHNFFSNINPRGEHAMTGDPGITLVGENPLRPPYYTINPDSPLLNSGKIICPLTDGFTGSAPDIGAIENGAALTIPVEIKEFIDE